MGATRWRWTRLLVLGLPLACRPSAPATSATPPPDPPPDAVAPTPPEPEPPCGETGLRIAHFAWVPSDAQAVARFDLADPSLADALRETSAFASAAGHGVPIDVGFAMSQWSWQVPGLGAVLAGAGFEPADLVYLRILDGSSAWVFPAQCDFEDAIARVEREWQVEVRRTWVGAVGTPRPGAGFAFDVVFLEGERMALAPVGTGSRLLERLSSNAPRPTNPAASLTAILDRLDRGPIRMVLRMHGLLDPASPPPEGGDPPLFRAFRGDARGFSETPAS